MNVVLFSFMYLISFHLVINSDDWFLLWLGLEVNMMTFILYIYKNNSLFSIESCLKYFFIQSMGSAILMGCFYLNESLMDFVICLIMGYKIGAGPFFFWFSSVCSGISWMSCFMLMSFQKVIPLMVIGFFVSWVVYIMIVIGLFFGVFGSFNQSNLKQLIAFSSIYHLGWIMLCIMSNDISWFMYLIMYSFMIFPVVNFLKTLSIEDILMFMKNKYKSWMIVFMLSMAGMPPFVGFFLKWFAFIMIFDFDFCFMVFLVVCSVVMFYVYFRLIYDILMSYYDIKVWSNFLNIEMKFSYLDMISFLGMVMGLFFSVFIFL